ncbi:MAG: pyridoxamine 5'-phosphate oxidase [Bacteroidetes bacterium]|nr:pyridoxamine 5'-phosphate oxidase [Bacteroidota bacterium]
MNRSDIADLRKEYTRAFLNPEDLPDNPLQAFANWFDFAIHESLHEPNAMVLSTAVNNRPSSRVVLLKGISEGGFVFYTNYNSKKGRELIENPVASLNFHWAQQERQVRIEGKVEKVSAQESDAYFDSRPRLSQAGAIVSGQSSVVNSRQELDSSMKELMESNPDKPLVRPAHWGGFRLMPDYLEFWQGRPGRVHDRIAYSLSADGSWSKSRLSP